MIWLLTWLAGALISGAFLYEPEDKAHPIRLAITALLWPAIWAAYLLAGIYCVVYAAVLRLIHG